MPSSFRVRRKKRMYRKRKPKTKSVKAIVRREFKNLAERKMSAYETQHDVSTTMSSAALLAPAQGDSTSTRTGDQVTPVRLWGRILLDRDVGGATATSMRMRVLIIRWKPNNADEAPAAATIFRNTAEPASGFVTNLADRGKFDVLYDRLVTLGNHADDTIKAQRILKVNIPFPMKPVIYDTGATTGRGIPYLITLGSVAAGASNGTAQPYFHLRFIDA